MSCMRRPVVSRKYFLCLCFLVFFSCQVFSSRGLLIPLEPTDNYVCNKHRFFRICMILRVNIYYFLNSIDHLIFLMEQFCVFLGRNWNFTYYLDELRFQMFKIPDSRLFVLFCPLRQFHNLVIFIILILNAEIIIHISIFPYLPPKY
jgi:hypothetical protein